MIPFRNTMVSGNFCIDLFTISKMPDNEGKSEKLPILQTYQAFKG